MVLWKWSELLRDICQTCLRSQKRLGQLLKYLFPLSFHSVCHNITSKTPARIIFDCKLSDRKFGVKLVEKTQRGNSGTFIQDTGDRIIKVTYQIKIIKEVVCRMRKGPGKPRVAKFNRLSHFAIDHNDEALVSWM